MRTRRSGYSLTTEPPSSPTCSVSEESSMQTISNRAEPAQDEPHSHEEISPPEQEQPAQNALAFESEPVLDGEVTAVIEPEQKPRPKQRPYYLLVVGTVLACLLFVAVSLIVPLLTPSAIVTIIPRQEHLSLTTSIPIQGRLLPSFTLSQSISVPATGKRHQDATRAAGTITFYYGLFTAQTIAAGTLLTGNDGVQVATDQAAIIPAATPPIFGQTTVSAHAIGAGSQGNIPAYDINQACCATAILAKNTTPFQGGAEARNYVLVTRADIDAATRTITATLEKSEHAALA